MTNIVYGLRAPTSVTAPKPIIAKRAPTTADLNKPLGTVWLDVENENTYILNSISSGSAVWDIINVETATSAVKGIASFDETDFTVSAGAVSINEDVVKTVAVSLTNAQIIALATTPVELVPAKGAGKVVKFLGASLKMVYGGTNVFTETDDNLGIKYTDASGVQVSDTIECTNFIDAAATTYTNAEPIKDAIVAATGCENKALVLDNLGDNFAGNAGADNTMEVSIQYRVVDFS